MMRHCILFLGIFLVSIFTAEAQTETVESDKKVKHELKINLAYALFETIEINYELILEKDFTIGLAANYWFLEDTDVNYQIIPSFRFYPSERRHASGFFIEGNLAFMSITGKEYDETSRIEVETTRFGGGMGVASGYKFLSSGNFVAELYLGVGRVFGDEQVEAYPRFGITMGKRF